ncbi:MAG: hypothetical protein HC782_05545 [Gammaproteobacteria bacterium]|nr:hypothetical protein [Gammaproteobacteria bacterium]
MDLGSVDLGDKAYNDETKSAVWLNAGKFPRATFVADKVVALGGTSLKRPASSPLKALPSLSRRNLA